MRMSELANLKCKSANKKRTDQSLCHRRYGADTNIAHPCMWSPITLVCKLSEAVLAVKLFS